MSTSNKNNKNNKGIKVHVEGGSRGYEVMFEDQGFVISDSHKDADLICFTGGEDVSPELYGHERHPSTYCSMARDMLCEELYRYAIINDIPMVGICRGSQFLCVMNGGVLVQDLDNHACFKGHAAFDKVGNTILVTSTHHQMMLPVGVEGIDFDVLLEAREGSYKDVVFPECDESSGSTISAVRDVEAVLWAKTKSFGFQPHPEFPQAEGACRDWFFENLNLILEDK